MDSAIIAPRLHALHAWHFISIFKALEPRSPAVAEHVSSLEYPHRWHLLLRERERWKTS